MITSSGIGNRLSESCRLCKGELEAGSRSRVFSYCPPCYDKLLNPPEMTATKFNQAQKKRQQKTGELVEIDE